MLIIVISNSVSELHLTRCLRAAAKQLKKVSFQAPLASGGRARRALVISELLHRFSICAHMNMIRHRVVNAKPKVPGARRDTGMDTENQNWAETRYSSSNHESPSRAATRGASNFIFNYFAALQPRAQRA